MSTTRQGDFAPAARAWRRSHDLAVLRLRVDITGADRVVRYASGRKVLGRWTNGTAHIAAGWIIQDLGFLQVLNEPDVEVLERP